MHYKTKKSGRTRTGTNPTASKKRNICRRNQKQFKNNSMNQSGGRRQKKTIKKRKYKKGGCRCRRRIF